MESVFKSVLQIITGGQTGVDRAALDAAIDLGVSTGGWCPKGRVAENGPIPYKYSLTETSSGDYSKRTKLNVIDSDGTVIIYFDELSGGTKLTHASCISQRKPCLLINGNEVSEVAAAQQIAVFVVDYEIKVLNIAGPRASKQLKAYPYTYGVITRLLLAK